MQTLFDSLRTDGYMPHGYCLTWNSPLLWLMAGSDALMTLCYATYPIAIAYFVWKRKDLHYRWLYLAFFNAFILTCAGTHFLSLVTIWIPVYWLEAYVNAFSAAIALATVFAIWWVIPRALKLPSPEELKKARDAAEAANMAKSAFLANMSHELRTPLNAILGFSNIIQKDAQFPEAQRRNLEIVNRSGEHLLKLINDVLDMAKIDAGRIQLEETPFDLGSLVRDVADMMSVRARDKGLRLLIDQSSEFPRFMVGDEARLRQMLINLVGNALKFTQQGGVTLRLGTRRDAAPHLIVEIEDTGPGIAQEDRQRIFEPFVQLGDQGDSKGTGLGLAITRQFVQLMGGRIDLESELGKGSLFRVELPLKEAQEEAVVQPKNNDRGEAVHLAPGQPSYRILIVEDQPENQLLLAHLMKSAGFEVMIAKNGVQGVERFVDWHPHLIWMDRRMPEMDGLDATRKIRALPGGQDVRIVAVSASAFMEQREEMLLAGMDDFIRKPYRAGEIYACMEKRLGAKFVYEGPADEREPIPQLNPQALASLPASLRAELKAALETLQSDRIAQVVEHVRVHDQSLHKAMVRLIDAFDYPAILDALE